MVSPKILFFVLLSLHLLEDLAPTALKTSFGVISFNVLRKIPLCCTLVVCIPSSEATVSHQYVCEENLFSSLCLAHGLCVFFLQKLMSLTDLGRENFYTVLHTRHYLSVVKILFSLLDCTLLSVARYCRTLTFSLFIFLA